MDEIIWTHIINGDEKAYSALYLEYFRKFFNYGRKFTPDDQLIEDSVQEVFLDFWKRRESLAKVKSVKSYFFSSFRYVLFRKIKELKKILPQEQLADEPQFYAEINIVNKETDLHLQQSLQLAIDELTPRQREAIFLRFYEGLSYEEVAEVLNISVKATYKIMARSLASLKDRLLLPLAAILSLLKIIW